jgi:hypothetical protein
MQQIQRASAVPGSHNPHTNSRGYNRREVCLVCNTLYLQPNGSNPTDPTLQDTVAFVALWLMDVISYQPCTVAVLTKRPNPSGTAGQLGPVTKMSNVLVP